MSPDDRLLEVSRLTSGPNRVTVRRWGAARVRAAWPPRRLLALALLVPGTWWLLASAPAAAQPWPLLLVVGLGVGASLASYVPRRGESMTSVLGSTCSAVGGVVPMACAVGTLVGSADGAGFIALAFVGFGLYQRFGATTCATG